MALPTSGPLTLAQIQGEFGGSNPISLSEYYAGGGLVPPGTTGTYGAVPSSGAISIRNFYGTSNFVPSTTTFTSSGTFTLPSGYATAEIEVWGGGGGGGSYSISAAANSGTASSVTGTGVSLTSDGGQAAI